jgi:hypothetical protein
VCAIVSWFGLAARLDHGTTVTAPAVVDHETETRGLTLAGSWRRLQ